MHWSFDSCSIRPLSSCIIRFAGCKQVIHPGRKIVSGKISCKYIVFIMCKNAVGDVVEPFGKRKIYIVDGMKSSEYGKAQKGICGMVEEVFRTHLLHEHIFTFHTCSRKPHLVGRVMLFQIYKIFVFNRSNSNIQPFSEFPYFIKTANITGSHNRTMKFFMLKSISVRKFDGKIVGSQGGYVGK